MADDFEFRTSGTFYTLPSAANAQRSKFFYQASNSTKWPMPFPYRAPDSPVPCHLEIKEDWNNLALARLIPRDGRIALAADLRWLPEQAACEWKTQWIYKQEEEKITPISIPPEADGRFSMRIHPNPLPDISQDFLQQWQQSRLESLQQFFSQAFFDYGSLVVRDIDPWSRYDVLYDLCSPSCAVHDMGVRWNDVRNVSDWLGEQDVFCQSDQRALGIAPWQRVIICEGLSFAQLNKSPRGFNFPFLAFHSARDPMGNAINLHLSGRSGGGSDLANRYWEPENAFHINFFEMLGQTTEDFIELSREASLKVGHLHDRPQNAGEKRRGQYNPRLAFRKSSFTVSTATRHTELGKSSQYPPDGDWYWTIVMLSTGRLFPYDQCMPYNTDLRQARPQTAELSFILNALPAVERKWRVLDEYIGSLLVEDFMDPASYSKLLFDDAAFSRSRLYFWIIGCLNEFNEVIEDNIKQLTLYRRARVQPLLDHPPESPKPSSSTGKSPDVSQEEPHEPAQPRFCRHRDFLYLQKLDKEAEKIRESFEDLRADFRAKHARAQALRDGLFNASALIESRSSTRLGMNVQLLTYVSIFYLPLAFCAALWAIPNITTATTRDPFIATAVLVGFFTYGIVFNLENISRFLGRAYFGRRKRLLDEMEEDRDEAWKSVRARFEDFPPKEEQSTPSEWRIFGYQMHRLFRRRTIKTRDTEGEEA